MVAMVGVRLSAEVPSVAIHDGQFCLLPYVHVLLVAVGVVPGVVARGVLSRPWACLAQGR